MKILKAYYGPDVSGVLRSGDYPSEASSYLVQQQRATAAGVSRWFTQAVYTSREAAEESAARWGSLPGTYGRQDLATGELTPDDEQPFTAYRVVTLLDLFGEGPTSIASTMYDLATSDHEWIVSSELGSEAKLALIRTEIEGEA